MKIYDILKEKANDEQFKNQIIYYDLETNKSYSFYDILTLVNDYLKIFSKYNLKGKKKYLIVDNSVRSITILITLLKCEAVPVLINVFDLKYEGNNYSKYLEFINQKYDYNEQLQNLKYDYMIANNLAVFQSPKEEIAKITAYIDSIDNKDIDGKGDLYICTSGTTTGVAKLVPLYQDDLIKNSLKSDQNYSILTTIPISSISGITYGVFRPIISNVKNYLLYKNKIGYETNIFKCVSFYKINRVLLMRDFIDVCDDNLKKLDFTNLNTIVLGGEVSNEKIIQQVRKYFTNLPNNAILSIYGNTENYGYICSCREEKIKSLYINALKSNSKEIVYTFDKKNIYKMFIANGTIKNERIDLSFNELIYANYISVSDSVQENVKIEENKIIGEIIVNNKFTGDLGVYIDNQLYVIGRKQDLVVIDNKEYILSMIEQMFSNITGLKTAAIINEKTNKIFVAINYNINPYIGNNFCKIIPIAIRCNRIIDYYNVPIEYPLFVPSNLFPKNKLMHKTNKIEIKNLILLNDNFQKNIDNYEENFKNEIKKLINKTFQKKVNVERKKNEFVFQKEEISFEELLYFGQNLLGYVHYREDDKNIYYIIDDVLLFGMYPEFNKKNGHSVDYYLKKINEKYLSMEKNSFYEYYNDQLNRKRRYCCLKLFGIFYENNDSFVFIPYQIAANNNYREIDKLKGEQLPFYKDNSSIGMIYLETALNDFYSESELDYKINYYSLYLNHVYKIKKSNYDFYIDSVLSDKNNIIYKELINDFFEVGFTNKRNNEEKSLQKSIFLSLNSIILGCSEYYRVNDYLKNYDKKMYYDFFRFHGVNFRDPLEFNDQIMFILDGMISSSCNDLYNDLGLVLLIEHNEVDLCKLPNRELFNICKKYTFKKMYELIENIRKMGKKMLFINGEMHEVDLSNVKLIIISPNEEMNEQYILKTIGKYSIIDLKSESKVLRKRGNNEY